MPESESLTPSEDADARGAGATRADEAGGGKASVEEVRFEAPRSDPVVRWLLIGISAVVILWLAGIFSALVFGMLTPSKSPRTATERNIALLSEQVQSGQADTIAWARYIDALVTAGQYSKARDVASTALTQAKSDKSYILAEQARLEFVTKDYSGAVGTADKAIAAADAEYQAKQTANTARHIAQGATRPDSWGLAVLTKAQSQSASGDKAGAIKTLDVYLAQTPTDSDILTQRGDLKAATGDVAGATKDYRQALKFIPDYKPALAGLSKIGAGAK
jgi:tetratricopeptide (TPR) repeat protein